MKKIAVVIVIIGLVVGAAVVWSQGPSGSRGPGMGFRMTCPAMTLNPPQIAMLERDESLGLSDEQKSNLKDALDKSGATLTPLRQKGSEAAQSLRTAVLADKYERDKVVELAAASQKAEDAIVNAEIDTWTKIRSILTAKQVEKLRQLMSQPLGGRRSGGYSPSNNY